MSYQISPRLPQSSVPMRCTGNDAVYSPQPFPTPDPPSSDVAPTPPQIHRSGKACMRRVDRRCVTEPPGEVRPISRSLEGNARPTCHAAGQPGHGSLSPESTTEGWPVAELLHRIGKLCMHQLTSSFYGVMGYFPRINIWREIVHHLGVVSSAGHC